MMMLTSFGPVWSDVVMCHLTRFCQSLFGESKCLCAGLCWVFCLSFWLVICFFSFWFSFVFKLFINVVWCNRCNLSLSEALLAQSVSTWSPSQLFLCVLIALPVCRICCVFLLLFLGLPACAVVMHGFTSLQYADVARWSFAGLIGRLATWFLSADWAGG